MASEGSGGREAAPGASPGVTGNLLEREWCGRETSGQAVLLATPSFLLIFVGAGRPSFERLPLTPGPGLRFRLHGSGGMD